MVIDPDFDSQLRVVCPKGFNPVEGRNFREFVCHNGTKIQETILTQKVRVAKAETFRDLATMTIAWICLAWMRLRGMLGLYFGHHSHGQCG